MAKDSSDQFSKKETEDRMQAALKGARIAGPKHRSGSADSAQKKKSARAEKAKK